MTKQWQTKLKWQKYDKKNIKKNDRQNEMTKKNDKKMTKKIQTKLKWQKKWQKMTKTWQKNDNQKWNDKKNDNKNDKKWQTNYFDFFNLCLPKFLLTVSTDLVLRREANWGKELLPTPESGLQRTQEHNGHAWRNDIRLWSVPCTNSTVVCWSSRTGR